MPTVRDVVSRKGQNVVTVAPDCTVLEAARIMMQGRIGGVLVCENDKVVGIFTERDVLRRVRVAVLERLAPICASLFLPDRWEDREVITGPTLGIFAAALDRGRQLAATPEGESRLLVRTR